MIIADHQGRIQTRWRAHATPVNAISADDNGENIASCSSDGNVVVRNLSHGEESPDDEGPTPPSAGLETISFGQPLCSVHLDPNYGRKGEKICVVSDAQGKLILSRRSWYTSKDVVLHSGEGAIASVAWIGTLLAWSNERGVKIINIETDEKVTFVEKPAGAGAACHLVWETEESIILAWTNSVQIVSVQAQDASSDLTQQRRFAQIVQQWGVDNDCTICGLAPFDEESVAVLCHVHEEESRGGVQLSALPEVHVRNRNTGELMIVPDALPVQGSEQLTSSAYSLQVIPL
jgi:WD40 repeat protein